MKTGVLFSLLFFCFAGWFVYPEKIGEVKDILKPFMVEVDDNTLYVTDQYSILLYSMDDLKLTGKISGKGEGPGYFSSYPKLKILDDKILAYSINYLAYFSKSGKLISDKKISKMFFSLDYVNGNVVLTIKSVATGNEKFHSTQYTIFDPNLKEIKTIHSEKTPVHRGGKKKHYLLEPLTSIQCYDGKIFLLDGQKGLFITIFDSQGNRLKDIEKDYEKIKVPESFKKSKYEEFINLPAIKKRAHIFEKMYECVFPEYFPPVQDFRIADGKMYIKTYKSLNQNVEFLVLDLNGKQLGKFYLPDIKNALFDIRGNHFYFLKENEFTDVWEFHKVNIQ